MLRKNIYIVIFLALCALILLSISQFISAAHISPRFFSKNTLPQTSGGYAVSTIPVPISDEEDLSQKPIDTELVDTILEKPEPVALQTTVSDAPKPTEPKKSEPPKCPVGNPLPGFNYLSPVTPEFGLDYYRPDDLVVIPRDKIPTPHTICVRSGTLDALLLMYTAMTTEGLKPMVVSGFRSSTYQKNIQTKNVSETLADGTTVRSVALPHHSEHQLGTTVDFAAAPAYNIKDFENSPEYAWMIQHAAEYGFVQSYHYGDESLTGYRGEPWHWRYVGPTHAQSVKDTGIILFQYLKQLFDESKIKNQT
jgi:LAS superfamily LD-carboxypeptidase LdcB